MTFSGNEISILCVYHLDKVKLENKEQRDVQSDGWYDDHRAQLLSLEGAVHKGLAYSQRLTRRKIEEFASPSIRKVH